MKIISSNQTHYGSLDDESAAVPCLSQNHDSRLLRRITTNISTKGNAKQPEYTLPPTDTSAAVPKPPQQGYKAMYEAGADTVDYAQPRMVPHWFAAKESALSSAAR